MEYAVNSYAVYLTFFFLFFLKPFFEACDHLLTCRSDVVQVDVHQW